MSLISFFLALYQLAVMCFEGVAPKEYKPVWSYFITLTKILYLFVGDGLSNDAWNNIKRKRST
jgi:hypothetical protein